MEQKKIDLFIVEGLSDESALGAPLSAVLKDSNVKTLVMRGDITTRDGVDSSNIISKIGDSVKGFVDRKRGLKLKDVRQIVHIVDTDGTYIPDEKVVLDEDLSDTVYASDGILTNDPRGIQRRNQKKRKALLTLQRNNSVRNIPYKVYYMSCNLDHVLYEKQNSTDQEKEIDAYAFAEKYHENPDGFVKYMCESEFSVIGTHKETWKFIEEGMNSVRRYTNFGNLFIE